MGTHPIFESDFDCLTVQDVVLLLDPSQPSWSVSSKALNMILNRFCINEEMAIESSGVYLSKYLTEARKKQINKVKLDEKVIDFVFKKIVANKTIFARKEDLTVHFIVADVYYSKNKIELEKLMIRYMEKYRIKYVVMTLIYMRKHCLITKKTRDDYCKGIMNRY